MKYRFSFVLLRKQTITPPQPQMIFINYTYAIQRACRIPNAFSLISMETTPPETTGCYSLVSLGTIFFIFFPHHMRQSNFPPLASNEIRNQVMTLSTLQIFLF